MRKTTLSCLKRLIKIFLAIILLPLCVGILKAFIRQIVYKEQLSPQQFYFLIGFGSYLLIQVIFFRPIRVYIFGHELTHAFWSIIFGGKVKEFNISKKGGGVLLTKTNFLINLAPYFFPIYTFFVLLARFILGIFIDVRPYSAYVMFLIGFSLSFHLALTFNSLTTRQPDVVKTGLMFSLVIILIINVITVMLILKIVTPEKIHLTVFFKDTFNSTLNIWDWVIVHTKYLVFKIRLSK